MSVVWEGDDVNYEAGEDLSNDQYHFVVLASGKVRRPDSATERPLGILQNDPGSGQAAQVRIGGTSLLVAGAGALAEGDAVTVEYVGATDAGKGVATTAIRTLVRAICIGAAGAEDALAGVRLTEFNMPDVHA